MKDYKEIFEKQGEHTNFLNKIQVGDKVTRNQDGVLVNLSQLKRVAKPIVVKSKDKKTIKSLKPSDKVEPKFREGDWIINNNSGGVYQVTEIKDDEYCLWPLDGEIMGYLRIIDVDNDYHLWTIRDAKDGDVLAAHECIVLFKEIDGLNIKCHCTYHYMGFNPSFYVDTLQNKDAFHPATKEQCQQLFGKITEEGFEWDAEKKELNPISEEYNDEDYGIDGLYHAQSILERTLGKVEGYQSDDGMLEHKCAISKVKKLYKKKIYWSEDDDENMNNVLYILKQLKGTSSYKEDNIAEKTINWIKSLKDRIGG